MLQGGCIWHIYAATILQMSAEVKTILFHSKIIPDVALHALHLMSQLTLIRAAGGVYDFQNFEQA